MSAEDLSPVAYFESRGYRLRVEQRGLHADHMARGEPGRASFYVEGRRYFVVDLLSADGGTLAKGYGIGETEHAALESARRRYGSEQE